MVGAGTNTIAYSLGGGTWTGVGSAIFSTAGYGAHYNGTTFLAVGEGTNTIAISYDAVNWRGLGTSVFSTAAYDVAGWSPIHVTPNMVQRVTVSRTTVAGTPTLDFTTGSYYNGLDELTVSVKAI
jgi:hypothetical protein